MTDYSAVQPAPAYGTFSVGGVLKRGFKAFFANLVPFCILALIFYLPTLLFGFFQLGQVESGAASADPTGQIIVSIVSAILTYILVGALVYGTVQYLLGRQASVGDIISRGMKTIGPVIVIAILLSLVIGIGFVLLIIPGVFLAVAYAVVIPAAVVERPGIMGAFSRSWQLTKGYRWQVLGILLVMIVILFAFAFIFAAVGGVVAFSMNDLTSLVIINYLISAISGAYMSVIIAVTYHDLRVAKEGVSTAQMAAVFD